MSKTANKSQSISEEILDFLYENFMIDPKQETIDPDVSLVLSGVIDSTGLLEIAVFIEKKWKIKIAPEDVNQANFGSVNKMVAFIQTKVKPEKVAV